MKINIERRFFFLCGSPIVTPWYIRGEGENRGFEKTVEDLGFYVGIY